MSSHITHATAETDILHRPHPELFDALENVEYGYLSLITPDGHEYEFTGDQPGSTAYAKLYTWRVLDDIIARGEEGFIDAYIGGHIATENLPELLTFIMSNSVVLEKFFYGSPWHLMRMQLRQIFGLGGGINSRDILARYELSPAFYALWLDKSLSSSAALFSDEAATLEEAQANKYNRILDKLEVQPGQHILDIGCGWGSFALHAVRRGLHITGITLSQTQADHARQKLQEAGFAHMASIEVADYRKLTGAFDHIVSIGMFEHVGERHWQAYFETLDKHLKPGGRIMIQTVTLEETHRRSYCDGRLLEQAVFPGGTLPVRRHFCQAAEHAGFACEDAYNFGKDYARTLQLWLDKFHANREDIKELGFDEAFLRMWRFHLSACLASFNSGRTDVMQIRLTRR